MIISLQLLRFIAAGMVVLSHSMGEFSLAQPIGAFGVDIFFVLSGFIISHITQESAGGFFKKRLVRIVPLYWLFTALISVVAAIFPSLLRTAKFDLNHIFSSLMFFPYWTEATKHQPILKLGWTLNFEMFFYLVFYFSMVISSRYREILCSIFILLAVTLIHTYGPSSQSSLYFYGNSIVYEFIFGMYISLLTRRFPPTKSAAGKSFIALVGSVSVFVLLKTPNGIPGLARYLAWGIPSAFITYSAVAFNSVFFNLSPRMKYLLLLAGELSYPIYLCHIYFIAAVSRIGKPYSPGYAIGFLVSLTLSVIFSYLLIHYYDKPVRKFLISI